MDRANLLQIWVKTSFGHVVGMAHIVASHGFLTTYFTDLCHDLESSCARLQDVDKLCNADLSVIFLSIIL
jgi:hypothetical protein